MKSITNLVGPRLLSTDFAEVATATPWSILSSSQVSFKHQLCRGHWATNHGRVPHSCSRPKGLQQDLSPKQRSWGWNMTAGCQSLPGMLPLSISPGLGSWNGMWCQKKVMQKLFSRPLTPIHSDVLKLFLLSHVPILS